MKRMKPPSQPLPFRARAGYVRGLQAFIPFLCNRKLLGPASLVQGILAGHHAAAASRQVRVGQV